MAGEITFVVSGEEAVARAGMPAAETGWTVKHSVNVATPRAQAETVRLTATPGEDVVVLRIANGPELILHPDHARDLLLAQAAPPSRGGATGVRRSALRPGDVVVPSLLQWGGIEPATPSRGWPGIGGVILKAIEILTGKRVNQTAAAVVDRIVAKFDGHVAPGVYRLEPQSLQTLKTGAVGRIEASHGSPSLVLVHGTFSDTSAFQKLWTHHPERVQQVFDSYGGRVFAFEHPTLGVSPIVNALELAKRLPKGARIHLLTHSRGGLIAEVLAQACARPLADVETFAVEQSVRGRKKRARLANDRRARDRGAGDRYERDRVALSALIRRVHADDIRVERIVRVACPTHGTLLASKRLDAFLSVFRWGLELARVPMVPMFAELLREVARHRADPGHMPGLEAQMPSSPLIQWLHSGPAIGGDLRVIAGDLQGDSVISWVKTLLTDAFFWTDHDLVVQTRSMYGGAPRSGSSFVLDRGGGVTHFEYFGNARTASAVTDALIAPPSISPREFATIGPQSAAGTSATGVRAARRTRAPRSRDPLVFVIPGIFGCNLAVRGVRVWPDGLVSDGIERIRYDRTKSEQPEPDGLVDNIYGDLVRFLQATHQVEALLYDWRRPIEDTAALLEARISEVLASAGTDRPVYIIAHSTGALVLRAMLLAPPPARGSRGARAKAPARDGWMKRVTRVLMLGPPHRGSWLPLQILSGDRAAGRLESMPGGPFGEATARKVMAGFPGLLQMQAGWSDSSLKLDRPATWQRWSSEDAARAAATSTWHDTPIQKASYGWGVPSDDVLERATALHVRLSEQDLRPHAPKLVTVVGSSEFTPDGFAQAESGAWTYLDAVDSGDGVVPLRSAWLDGVPTWTIPSEHFQLPAAHEWFPAFLGLLETGRSEVMTQAPKPTAAEHGIRMQTRPARMRSSRPSLDSVFDRTDVRSEDPEPTGTAIRVQVLHGDLGFVSQPLMIGHYRSLRLTGTERVMDEHIGGTMTEALAAGLYPDRPGSHQVFANPNAQKGDRPRPPAVIVAGLGDEGELRPAELSHSVCQAALAWGQRLAETPGFAAPTFEIAATLIGSGGTGIPVAQSAQLVAQGVHAANQRLAAGDWPRVERLQIVELYRDRATEALRALQMLAETQPGCFAIHDAVETGTAGLTRPLDAGYRGADYDYITAITEEPAGDRARIVYTLDTRRARVELRARSVQLDLVRELVVRGSNDRNVDARVGNTLFRLLIPVELESFFDGSTEMVIELDAASAGIPWELLDHRDGDPNAEPWALRCKLLRKLRTERFRSAVTQARTDSGILVIGEPKCDPDVYPRLRGAWEEARAVADALQGENDVKALISADPDTVGADALEILNALHERPWRIIHVAGHGEPPVGANRPRGVVLSKGYLGPDEIQGLQPVPELVFVNCCHLAALDPKRLLAGGSPFEPPNRARFASGVAEELIRIGVRCVIAAGWAVDDRAADAFATTFYRVLLDQGTFIEAVAAARRAARRLDGNTWGAYQCYGDPDWTFRPGAMRAATPASRKFAAIVSSDGLLVALEKSAIGTEFWKANPAAQAKDLRYLEDQFAAQWGEQGDVAEAFGRAWWALSDAGRAAAWYERAVGAEDGRASLHALQQLDHILARPRGRARRSGS